MALYTLTMKWDPPNDGEPLDAVERALVAEKIRAAFDFMGWTLEVVNDWRICSRGRKLTNSGSQASQKGAKIPAAGESKDPSGRWR